MASWDLTRRSVLAGAAASVLIRPAFAAPADPEATIAVVPEARTRVAAFLAALDEDLRAKAQFDLGSRTWRNWNYFGLNLIKPGVPLRDMTEPQQEAAYGLLGSVFSAHGLEKADRVMHLQDVLAARGDPRRSSENFSFAVFGEPGADSPWAFRLEGHHLTATATFMGDALVAVTPSSFSCNPNAVETGERRGMVALTDEETLARTLFADLQGAPARHALISDRAYRNIRTAAGREDSLTTLEGVPAADLTAGQTDLLWALVETYAVDHLGYAIADNQRTRIRSGDRNAVHFAWAGPNRQGEPFYYRVSGPTFLIELGTVDRAAQHLHTIYHDLDRSLGRHVLAG